VSGAGADDPSRGIQPGAAAAFAAEPCTGGWFFASGVLILAVLLAHGWSLRDGLSLDDHWHYHSIPRASWTLRGLLDATTLDAAEQVQLWWQEKDVRFVYARPVAVALLKVTYALSGDDPFAAHCVSLALHFFAALLVCALARQLTGRRGWGLFAGLAFALYPHTVYAAGWLAAQNIVLQTALMLAALLCYVRASGLVLSPAAATGTAQAVGETPTLRVGSFVIVLVFWVAALFSRENAIMLPGIIVALDLAYGGWRRVVKRWPAYVVFAVLGLAFLVWRLKYFYEPMPDVYVQSSGAPGYWLWCVAKLFHYLCTALIPASMTVGPSGRYQPFREIPLDMAAMVAIVVVLLGLYVLVARRARGYWIWPCWVLLAVAPVISVLATPHSGYLCGVGVAVALAVACDQLARRPARAWRRTARGLAVFVILSYAVSMKVGRLLWMGMVYAEQFTMMGLKAAPPAAQAEHVFLVNLPFAGIYAKRCLAEVEGPRIDALAFHVLTFAPYLIRMDADSAMVPVDEHTLTLEIRDDRYFSGLLGRFLIAGFRERCPFETGQTFDAGEFAVEILDADAGGVRKLAFRFDRPLNDPAYCFYVSSYECGAVRVDLAPPAPSEPLPAPPERAVDVLAAADDVLDGRASAAGVVFAALAARDRALRETAEEAIELHFTDIANALAAPVQQALVQRAALPENAENLWRWWQQRVTDDELAQIYQDRALVRRIRHRRDEIHRARERTGVFIRSDLTLTGPPFPSLRPDSAGCGR